MLFALACWVFLFFWRRYACGSAPACGSKVGDDCLFFPGLAPRATYLSALRASQPPAHDSGVALSVNRSWGRRVACIGA